jgi:hypothetical protein
MLWNSMINRGQLVAIPGLNFKLRASQAYGTVQASDWNIQFVMMHTHMWDMQTRVSYQTMAEFAGSAYNLTLAQAESARQVHLHTKIISRSYLHSNRLTGRERRPALCVGEKAWFEPRTSGTKAECGRAQCADNCTTRPGPKQNTNIEL